MLLLFKDDVVHMPHLNRAPYHTLYIPNSTIPHAHTHPLSQPPKRDMTHSSHNMAQLPFLYAVVQIHAQRCMHKDTCTEIHARLVQNGYGGPGPGVGHRVRGPGAQAQAPLPPGPFQDDGGPDSDPLGSNLFSK